MLHFCLVPSLLVYTLGLGTGDSMATKFQTERPYLGLEPTGVIVSGPSIYLVNHSLIDRLPLGAPYLWYALVDLSIRHGHYPGGM